MTEPEDDLEKTFMDALSEPISDEPNFATGGWVCRTGGPPPEPIYIETGYILSVRDLKRLGWYEAAMKQIKELNEQEGDQ